MIWVGSGASAPAGLPDWNGLRSALETALEQKARSLDAPGAERANQALSRIRGEANPWRAFEWLKEALGETTYSTVIKGKLGPGQTAVGGGRVRGSSHALELTLERREDLAGRS